MDELTEAGAVLATAIESESEEDMVPQLDGKDGVISGNTEHPSTFELSSKDLENQAKSHWVRYVGQLTTGYRRASERRAACSAAVHPLDLPVLTGFDGLAAGTG